MVRDYLAGTTATSVVADVLATVAAELYGHSLHRWPARDEKLPQTIVTPTTKGATASTTSRLSAARFSIEASDPGAMGRGSLAGAGAVCPRPRARGAPWFDLGRYQVRVRARRRRPDHPRRRDSHADSSRYWLAASYAERFADGEEPETLDKDFLRRWIIARCDPYTEPIPAIPSETLVEFSLRYISLYEMVTGERFSPPPVQPKAAERLGGNLTRYLRQGSF